MRSTGNSPSRKGWLRLTPVGRRRTLQVEKVKIVHKIFLIGTIKRPRHEATTRCSGTRHATSFGRSISQVEIGHPSLADGTLHVLFTDDIESTSKASRTQ